MEGPKDVMPGSSQDSVEETQEEGVTEEITPKTQNSAISAGSKTPSENLLAALQEERRKRKEAEDKIISLSSQSAEIDDVFSDEGKFLKKQIQALQDEIKSQKEKEAVEGVYSKYPALKEQTDEFNQFKADRPGYSVEDVAKLFLVEKGLAETPPRKGLEKRTVGQKTNTSDGYTAEEVADLRKNNHRKYMDLLSSGKIRLDELK